MGEYRNGKWVPTFGDDQFGVVDQPHMEQATIDRLNQRIAELEAENERLRGVCVEFEHHASEELIQQSNRNAEHHEKTMKQAIKWMKLADERGRRMEMLRKVLDDLFAPNGWNRIVGKEYEQWGDWFKEDGSVK